jgi:hypothetical protein
MPDHLHGGRGQYSARMESASALPEEEGQRAALRHRSASDPVNYLRSGARHGLDTLDEEWSYVVLWGDA